MFPLWVQALDCRKTFLSFCFSLITYSSYFLQHSDECKAHTCMTRQNKIHFFSIDSTCMRQAHQHKECLLQSEWRSPRPLTTRTFSTSLELLLLFISRLLLISVASWENEWATMLSHVYSSSPVCLSHRLMKKTNETTIPSISWLVKLIVLTAVEEVVVFQMRNDQKLGLSW